MYQPRNTNGDLKWFAGNEEALLVYRFVVDLAHIWDDLVDRDKEVTDADVNYAFAIPLAILPTIRFWQVIQPEVQPFWTSVVMSYMVANDFEKRGEPHRLEISHGLRYAVVQLFTYIITRLNGAEQARAILNEALPQMMPERLDAYLTEHIHD